MLPLLFLSADKKGYENAIVPAWYQIDSGCRIWSAGNDTFL